AQILAGEDFAKALCCLLGKFTLARACPPHLRRIDALNAHLLTVDPERVAIDNAGDPLAGTADRHRSHPRDKRDGFSSLLWVTHQFARKIHEIGRASCREGVEM